ncbi:hypothetical protein P2D89_14260 [Agrobacterium rhizogenes]|nr:MULTISPECIES: hypothetical protein [Rhizobium/Agrobacterium group]MDA5635007.1 hypothetical protein [Agrobacterium sp. ST15.16.024]MDF1890155.1 hypothetical protein [Rhizobium rhizogenes]
MIQEDQAKGFFEKILDGCGKRLEVWGFEMIIERILVRESLAHIESARFILQLEQNIIEVSHLLAGRLDELEQAFPQSFPFTGLRLQDGDRYDFLGSHIHDADVLVSYAGR